MSTSGQQTLSTNQENDRLREHIARLEDELHRLRQTASEQHSPSAQLASDQYYKEVFDHLSVCMFFIDVTPDSRFRYAAFNPAEEAALGIKTEQVAGKYVEEVFEPELAQKLAGNYRQCLEAGRAITYDDALNLPSGRRHFHSNLIPLRNGSGAIHRIIGACIDTTDLKRTQEESISLQKLESLGVLAAGIAHDFNNLLGSILAEADLAETELTVGASPRRQIQAIQSVATRAGEMVRQLMTYAGQDTGAREPIDLSAVVQEMLELLKISVSKNAILEISLPKDLPAIRADAVQLRQVIMNLITNASEALGEDQGVISVSITRAPAPDGRAESSHKGVVSDYLQLTISDTGKGMTPEVLSRIFDPFYTTKFSGRGLGLSAVQGIIRSHGGSIQVTSTLGNGARFDILLPCSVEKLRAADHGEQANQNGGAVRRGTILLVEDEGLLRTAVATMLRNQGFQVMEASDGTTGLELFRNNDAAIDAIVLDMTLPRMSGAEVFAAVRESHPDAKVILTSAYSREALNIDVSPWAYIRKPYRTRELSDLLLRACG